MKTVFLTLFVLVAALCALFWHFRAPCVAGLLTRILGVGIDVQAINVNGLSGIEIKGFGVHNVAQNNSGTVALYCETITVRYSFQKLFANPRVIDLVQLDRTRFRVEKLVDLGKTNFDDILSTIEEKKEEKPEQKEAKKVLISQLLLTNSAISLIDPVFGNKELSVKHIEMHNVGEESELSSKLMVEVVLRNAVRFIFENPILKGSLKGATKIFQLPGKVLGEIFKRSDEEEVQAETVPKPSLLKKIDSNLKRGIQNLIDGK